MSSTNQPNTTLYVNNLNDAVTKQELRLQLFALFSTYGKIIDIVASKSKSMRGQAFLVFTDLAGATAAMRACEGMIFYDKPMRIDYAKTKSWASLKREDPNFVPPTSVNASKFLAQNAQNSEKRQREESNPDGERSSKREKGDDSDDEEMEIDDDDEDAASKSGQQSSAKLLCTNLPLEVTDGVLSVLFQQYNGLRSTQVVPSPTPNAQGEKIKMAHVTFASPELAKAAKQGLDGFSLKKGWIMSVAFA